MKLSSKQFSLLDLVSRGEDPYHGITLSHQAFVGRSKTLHSLQNRGLIERTGGGDWRLTDTGKEVLAK